ncbi:unnamed protein product [Schistosoma margrebowiei]|uniref:Uncharacterized protein n=1 Tax=Schistosoma margrebowiei TaxID=48269 RepID=A0A3P7YXJ0_9TREM|nr:unnamed protein product [Schistosoma margrebowiei]
MRELVLPGRFDLVSLNFTVRDVTTELSLYLLIILLLSFSNLK